MLTFSKMSIFPDRTKDLIVNGKQHIVALPAGAMENGWMISPLVHKRNFCLLVEKISNGYRSLTAENKLGKIVVGVDYEHEDFILIWATPVTGKHFEQYHVYFVSGSSVCLFISPEQFRPNETNRKVDLSKALGSAIYKGAQNE